MEQDAKPQSDAPWPAGTGTPGLHLTLDSHQRLAEPLADIVAPN